MRLSRRGSRGEVGEGSVDVAEHVLDVGADVERLTVTAGAHDVVLVRLPENGTTGYVWNAAADGELDVDGDRLLRASGAAGAGGLREFRLAVRGPGRVQLDLARPWEDAPRRSVVVDVVA